MDDFLPSYESAVQQSPWELIAPYLASNDLCSAALVSHKWHSIFTPQLWGNPASHFGVENDTVYVALNRFKRTLLFARQQIRAMTHTLHLPPAHAEIYGGPHYEWLRDCLERLPNLQSLIVNGLPFLDHAALLTLRHASLRWQSSPSNSFPTFGLRLLDASGCINATAAGLAEALIHFPDLVYLNLSSTPAAKNEQVLRSLKVLKNLRVLKLAAIGLKDFDLGVVATSIGIRVRSLDVTENNLTDNSARLLLEHCIKETTSTTRPTPAPRSPIEDGYELDEEAMFGTVDLEVHIRTKLTHGFIGSLAVENAREAGITELYISRNIMTVEGISALLRSKRLQVLDMGTLPAALRMPEDMATDQRKQLRLPGIEKLTPVLAQCASSQLKYLRMGYTVVTKDAPIDALPSPRAEMEADHIRPETPVPPELETREVRPYELDSMDTGIYELPGDNIQAELPVPSSSAQDTTTRQQSGEQSPSVQLPAIEVSDEPQKIKRGPAYAPEPVWTEPYDTLLSPLDATGGLSPMATRSPTVTQENGSVALMRRQSSESHMEERMARLHQRQSEENRLHPGMLPKVHTLILTDVPSKTNDKESVRRLIQFIEDCAEEAAIARLQAKHTYVLPPGRSRPVAEREYAASLFALKRIVLEMEQPEAARKEISTSWRQYPTLSSTEDPDSETFWEAATHDFSFFADEERGLPGAEAGFIGGLMLADETDTPAPKTTQSSTPAEPAVDVIAQMAQFRKERKAAYEHSVQQLGDGSPIVEGYWPGDVTVVWKSADAGALDYYGNRYQAGWLYR